MGDGPLHYEHPSAFEQTPLPGASFVVQLAKPLLAALPSHIRVPVGVLSIVLSIQFSVDAPGKAMDMA